MLKKIQLSVPIFTLLILSALTGLHAEWVDNGIPLGNASGAQDSPAIAADSTGGAVIVWRDSRSTVNTDIYAQGVAADGSVRWYPQGMPVCTATNSQSAPMVVADGTGGSIVVWQDNRTGGTLDIYAQKLSSIGYIQWASNGVAVCTGQPSLSLCDITSDGAGGVIITWQDRRNYYSDIFVQRVSSNGTVMWISGGVPVCEADNHQQKSVIAPDGTNGAIIAWEDRRNGGYDIYAQRIGSNGTAVWAADGDTVCVSGDNQMNPSIVADGSGGAVIAWEDRRNTMDFDIFAQRISSAGELQWGFGTPVSAWMGDQKDCRLVHIGSGATVVTWIDSRSGISDDIYAQKISSGGSCLWASNGAVVCDAAGDQENPGIAYNGSGGAMISWVDQRAGTDDRNIRAQNIGSDGNPLWSSSEEIICDADGNQLAAVICEDGLNGIFFGWTDNRSGTDKVFAQRVDGTGHIPTATLLQQYSAETEGINIRIHWVLSEIDPGGEFRIQRAEESSMRFSRIPLIQLERSGLSYSFLDTGCEPGVTYHYRVFYEDGTESRLLFQTGGVTATSESTILRQNLPNPFNPSTVIGYNLEEKCSVRLAVYDVRGTRVRLLVNSEETAGEHRVIWNGRDEQGNQASSGVYFCRLKAGRKELARRMVLLR